MARTPSPLPEPLRGIAFGVAQHADVTPARARASDLWTPTRGVRLPTELRDLASVCLAHTVTAPAGAVFSHTTAAELHEMPLPGWARAKGVHITVPVGTRAPRRTGVIGHQQAIGAEEVVELRGLRLTNPVRTFCDLADLLDLTALVVVGDHLIRRRRSVTDAATLATAIATRSGRRGTARLRAALALLDTGSESPKETELRLVLRSAGFWPLEANLEIHDRWGRFVARVDLAIAGLRIAIEYEGDHHRDRDQWRRDISRRRRIEAEGWLYLSVTQSDLSNPRQLIADLRAAIASRA